MEEAGGNRRGSVAVRLLVSLLLLATAAWLIINRQYAMDQLAVWTYQPTSEVASIARTTTMSEEGKFYFYASRPQVQERHDFNDSCRSVLSEESAVLGCYAAQQIYIYDVNDQRLNGIEEVTAAHEMLHAAYERLSARERQEVNRLIEARAERITDPQIIELLKIYERTEPGERLNELHSILATQVKEVGPDLEAHYVRYFDDRQRIVSLYNDYNTVFVQLKARQEQLAAELERLASRINSDTQRYNDDARAFEADVRAYEQRTYTSQAAADADRQALLARQAALESLRQSIEAARQEYDQKYQQLQALNMQSLSLNQSFNSSLEPVQTVD